VIKKVLIIKTGYSETFVNEVSEQPSLGDVLRSTALLHLFKDCYVVWLTADVAAGLLVQNPYISEILIYDLSSVLRLLSEEFDVVINLEKAPGLCALGDRIKCWQRYGFRFQSLTGKAEAYLQSTEALYIANNEARKHTNHKHWLELLYEMIGEKWRGEGYMLGYKPPMPIQYEIGFNYRVGRKFEGKAWDTDNWIQLEKLVYAQEPIQWQPIESTVLHYCDWIQRCKIIVTNDSLGLHIAMALGKWVVGLFGPTPAKEIQPYEKGIMIQKAKMEDITVEEVYNAICSLRRS
jgi:heptosyltransferase-2